MMDNLRQSDGCKTFARIVSAEWLRRSRTAAGMIVCAYCLIAAPTRAQERTLTVGSKAFTESVILAHVAAQTLEASNLPAQTRTELGGTRFVWNALVSGQVDVYPEYTGTIVQEILGGSGGGRGSGSGGRTDKSAGGRTDNSEGSGTAEDSTTEIESLQRTLEALGVGMTAPLGFNNTYALGMREAHAEELGIRTISDLRDHADVTLAFSNEFMDRADGWPGLRAAYDLPHPNVRGLDHDLAYRGLAGGSIDVTDLYSTDAEIAYYDLRILEDDRRYFPAYEAVLLYRLDLPAPAVAALERLAGAIDESAMIRMNAQAKIERIAEARIAAEFLTTELEIQSTQSVQTTSRLQRVARHTGEHLSLVGISLLAAILISIPLGILAARYDRAGQIILGIVGVIYTIPALALLVFMIPLMGIGGPPAIVALFLYSLLPIVRNTHAGLKGIAPELIESADALGLSPAARLQKIELPLASRTILAGIKTSAVINIGTATLGALIGAGGYGQPILTGIRLDDVGLILEGAVPAALLALAAQGLFEIAERFVVPKGLRLASA